MSVSYTKHVLSESTDGMGIKITTTSTPGDTLHTAHATDLDEIWIYLYNTDTASVKYTIEFGGTTSPDDTVEGTLEGEKGAVLVIPGWILTNSKVVKCFAASANLICANGWVNRITSS